MASSRRAGRRLPGLLLASLAWASCTAVMEDRSGCPCTLYLLADASPEAPLTVQIYDGDGLPRFRHTLRSDTTLAVPLPWRGRARVAGITGGEMGEDGLVKIPPGEDCPEVYLDSRLLSLSKDTVECRLHLKKHFCRLELEVGSPPGWEPPFEVQLRGKVNGLYPDGSALEGEFRHILELGESCRLPRQAPETELWLDITLPEGAVRSFALGNYLLEAGYDWSRDNLKDFSLELQLSVTGIHLSMDEWRSTIPWEVVI